MSVSVWCTGDGILPFAQTYGKESGAGGGGHVATSSKLFSLDLVPWGTGLDLIAEDVVQTNQTVFTTPPPSTTDAVCMYMYKMCICFDVCVHICICLYMYVCIFPGMYVNM